jgi:hypothetical protein
MTSCIQTQQHKLGKLWLGVVYRRFLVVLRIALQVDIDGNGQFLGQQETAYTQRPTKACPTCAAEFEYNWSWYSQYGSGTYGMRVDFTNSAYYFTGNSSTLAATGAYINVTVVGTTDFQTTALPRLYRNSSTTIQAKLVDNSLQPVRNAAVNYTWSADGRSGVNYTDDSGLEYLPSGSWAEMLNGTSKNPLSSV